MFLTRLLSGVAEKRSWLHDGRATSLDKAFRAHGGAAADSRDAYGALNPSDRNAILAYLEAQVMRKLK